MQPYFTIPYFKMHSDGISTIPLSPVSFYNWEEYFKLVKEITFKSRGFVSNRQILSNDRRKHVRDLLSNQAEFLPIPQTDFWYEVNKCVVSVCVPGQRIDILDRGQLQYMAFGACTISPRLVANLPWNTVLQPDEDYVQCADGFSDLLEKVQWCKTHTRDCIEIGRNAQRKFTYACTPERQLKWLRQHY
jgi:hypothetical protein